MGMYAAGLTAAAGSTTLPSWALVGSTAAKLHIRQVWIFNASSTACQYVFCRVTTAGTPGASATSRILDGTDVQAATGILKNTYTSTAPTTQELGIGFRLPAADAGGLMIPFEHGELVVPAVANAAIGLILETGTGQAHRVSVKWQES